MKKSPRKKPKFGTLRSQIQIHDPDWWKPMTDKEVEEFIGDETIEPPERAKPAPKKT